jgi:DNA-binding NtrC family response regulator
MLRFHAAGFTVRFLPGAFRHSYRPSSMNHNPSSRRILVVEDDSPLLAAVDRALTEAGETVVGCADFNTARAALRDGQFDAMITDVRLGDYNGLQLAVMARDLQPDIRIIVYSGYNDPVLREEADRIGATYLVKPVPSARLLEIIRSA